MVNDTVVRVSKTQSADGTASLSADQVFGEQTRRRFLHVYVAGAGTVSVGIGEPPGNTGLQVTSASPLLLNVAVIGAVWIKLASGSATYIAVEGIE